MLRSYLIIAARLRIFFTLILRNGISLYPRYLFTFFFLLQAGFWSSFLAFREKLIHGRKIKKAPLPRDPIFIVGHWRTGTTFLHQLLNCDPRLTTPTLLQCTYPESFMSSYKYIAPVMKLFLSKKRPMDNVTSGIDEPQEEEYALFRMSGFSPIEKLIFPHSSRYFLLDTEHFLPPESKRHQWENALLYFTKKLHLYTGKRIVFKNPFHSLRIPTLLKLFPDALFIHIYRDPRIVIPSTVHMWTIVGKENALRKEWKPPKFEEVVTGFGNFMTHTYKDLSTLPKEKYIEIPFEDLEKDPITIIQTIYKHFGIDYSTDFEAGLNTFLKKISGYKKNRYEISKEQEELICNLLQHHLKRGNYN